jgi:hypothetical protein
MFFVRGGRHQGEPKPIPAQHSDHRRNYSKASVQVPMLNNRHRASHEEIRPEKAPIGEQRARRKSRSGPGLGSTARRSPDQACSLYATGQCGALTWIKTASPPSTAPRARRTAPRLLRWPPPRWPPQRRRATPLWSGGSGSTSGGGALAFAELSPNWHRTAWPPYGEGMFAGSFESAA